MKTLSKSLICKLQNLDYSIRENLNVLCSHQLEYKLNVRLCNEIWNRLYIIMDTQLSVKIRTKINENFK